MSKNHTATKGNNFQMYELRMSNSFKRQLKKMDKDLIKFVLEQVESLKFGLQNNKDVKSLSKHKYEYRLKISKTHRVLFNLDKKMNIIDLKAVGHRKEVYRC